MSDSINLQQRLDAMGITQSVFAMVAGVHRSEVSRQCSGFAPTKAASKKMAETVVRIELMMNSPLSVVPNVRSADSIVAAIAEAERYQEQVRKSTLPVADILANATA